MINIHNYFHLKTLKPKHAQPCLQIADLLSDIIA